MTDIHVESWTLNKNGDKQTTATKKKFYPKSQFAQQNRSSKKALETQKKKYIDGKEGTHKIKFRSSAHLKSK